MSASLRSQLLTGASAVLNFRTERANMPGCAMPFSKHNIDPERIEAMRAAFYRVCDALLLKGDVEDPMTEVIVEKIVALAKAGEYDANRLAELVLNDLVDDGLSAAG
jgi:hypothetical protein